MPVLKGESVIQCEQCEFMPCFDAVEARTLMRNQQSERDHNAVARIEASIASVRNDFCVLKRALVDYNRHRGHLDVSVEETISRATDHFVDAISKVADKGDCIGKLLEHLERHYGKFERAIRTEAGKKPSVARFVRICKTISDAVTQSVLDHDHMVSFSTCLFEGCSLLCENPRERLKAQGLPNDLYFTKVEQRQLLAAYKEFEQSFILMCGENLSLYKQGGEVFRFQPEKDNAKTGRKKLGGIFVDDGSRSHLLYDNTPFDVVKRCLHPDYMARRRWEEVKDCLVDELLDREYVYNLLLVKLGENTDVAFRDYRLLQERSNTQMDRILVYYCRKLVLAEYDAAVAKYTPIPNSQGVHDVAGMDVLRQRAYEGGYDRARIEVWLDSYGLSIEALRAYDKQDVNDDGRRHVAKGVVRVNLDNMSVQWTDARQPIVTKSEAYFLVVVMAFLRFGEGRSPADWGDVVARIKQLNIGEESPFLWCRKDRLLCADTNKLFQRVRERFEEPMKKDFGKDFRLLPCDKRGRGALPGPANWWEYVGVEWVSRQKVTVLFPRDGFSMMGEVLKLIFPSREVP